MSDDALDAGPRTARWLRSRPLDERLRLAIPKAWAMAELDDASPMPALAALSNYVARMEQWAEDGLGLRLFGPGGSGKSYLAAGVLKAIVRAHQMSGAWCSTTTYLDLVRADFGEGLIAAGYRNPYSLLYVRRRYDVVVLDGLGQERRTPNSDSLVHELLRYRTEALLPTIITTSLPLADIAERYGESCSALISRTTMEVKIT